MRVRPSLRPNLRAKSKGEGDYKGKSNYMEVIGYGRADDRSTTCQ